MSKRSYNWGAKKNIQRIEVNVSNAEPVLRYADLTQ